MTDRLVSCNKFISVLATHYKFLTAVCRKVEGNLLAKPLVTVIISKAFEFFKRKHKTY